MVGVGYLSGFSRKEKSMCSMMEREREGGNSRHQFSSGCVAFFLNSNSNLDFRVETMRSRYFAGIGMYVGMYVCFLKK